MAPIYEFQGWLGLDKNSVNGNLQFQKFEPKKWEETDVDVQITHCGICGSDLHTLRSGWGPTIYPCCVGHEIVGHIVRLGEKVPTMLRIGDRVGVGPQSLSCLRPDECAECTTGRENYCQNVNVITYNATYPDDIGNAYGGYASHWRGHCHFVIKIPEGLSSEVAAPMLCAGTTVFSPLAKHKTEKRSSVGIIGIGGLGHYGIQFAKALGYTKVVAISRSTAKRSDALAMGADEFVATDEDGWEQKHALSLDLILSTVNGTDMPLAKYLDLLRPLGRFIQLGEPEVDLPPISAGTLIGKGISVGGSTIGSPGEIREMLDLAVAKRVKGWVETRPMTEVNQALIDMGEGRARYRYVLTN